MNKLSDLFTNVLDKRRSLKTQTGIQDISFICDKRVTTQNFAIFELLVQKETFAYALLTGVVS